MKNLDMKAFLMERTRIPWSERTAMDLLDVLVAVALCCIGGWIALRLRRWFSARVLRRRFAIGARAEQDAVPLLERLGYTIVDEQATSRNIFFIDEKEVSCDVRADLLVEKDGRRFVVEVKSGDSAPDPKNSATRRQLLEYEHVFRPDGLLLADMRAGVLKRVEFRTQGRQPLRGGSPVPWMIALISGLAGLVLGLRL